ncbi:MAG: Hsp70 family protein, partial [Labedaea sp.]
PVSLDQPETAVALGAHHVTPEGISPRTQNLGGHVAAGRPVPGPPPRAYPGPPSGGFAAPVPPPAVERFAPAPVPAAGRKATGRRLLIAAAAVVVVALAVLGGIYLLSPKSDLPSAEGCQQKGGKDGTGFTSCLRQLAGTVPDHNQCQAGDAKSVADVSCTLTDDYKVNYAHVASQDDVERVVNTQLGTMTSGEHVEADWKGNGLDGRLRAGVSGGTGVLVFTVKDRPLVGWLTKTQLRGGDFTADTLADYFAAQVQPGT